VVNNILTAAFEDELEKIAASRSFFGDMKVLNRMGFRDLFPKKPKVPSINLHSTTPRYGYSQRTYPTGPSFGSISRELKLTDEQAIPMIREAKRRARATGRSSYDILREMAKVRELAKGG